MRVAGGNIHNTHQWQQEQQSKAFLSSSAEWKCCSFLFLFYLLEGCSAPRSTHSTSCPKESRVPCSCLLRGMKVRQKLAWQTLAGPVKFGPFRECVLFTTSEDWSKFIFCVQRCAGRNWQHISDPRSCLGAWTICFWGKSKKSYSGQIWSHWGNFFLVFIKGNQAPVLHARHYLRDYDIIFLSTGLLLNQLSLLLLFHSFE